MKLPDPKQQHEDNMTLFKFVTATILIYLLVCAMMGACAYALD